MHNFSFQMACCGGSEGLFPGGGGEYCNLPKRYTSARVAPIVDTTPTTTHNGDIRRKDTSHSQDYLQLVASSSSQDGKSGARKRPLAVAVGYKYAEDMHGRPIVITPGNRRLAGKHSIGGTMIRSTSSCAPQRGTVSTSFSLPPPPRQHVSVKPSRDY
jgi:hypothetical protein